MYIMGLIINEEKAEIQDQYPLSLNRDQDRFQKYWANSYDKDVLYQNWITKAVGCSKNLFSNDPPKKQRSLKGSSSQKWSIFRFKFFEPGSGSFAALLGHCQCIFWALMWFWILLWSIGRKPGKNSSRVEFSSASFHTFVDGASWQSSPVWIKNKHVDRHCPFCYFFTGKIDTDVLAKWIRFALWWLVLKFLYGPNDFEKVAKHLKMMCSNIKTNFFFFQQIYRSHQQALAAGATPAANQGQQQSLALLQQQQQQIFAQQQLAGN